MNKVLLIGHVGRDPEMSYTPTGTAVARFSLAVSRRWKDKESGETKDETTWFSIVAWDRLAETCSQYIHKGDKLYAEGRLVMRDYTDKDNAQRKAVEVHLETMEFLSSPSTAAGAGHAPA